MRQVPSYCVDHMVVLAIYHIPSSKHQSSNSQRRGIPILSCQRSRTEYCWSCRVEKESRCGNLIPDPQRYKKKDLRRRWQGLQFSNRSYPIRGVRKPLQERSCSFKAAFTCIMAGIRPKEDGFSSDSWVFYCCRSVSPWDAAITYRFPPKWGEGRDEKVYCIPTDYPSRVSGYTAFGHSDSTQSQAIIMRMHLRPAKILLRFKPFSLVEGLRRGNNLLGFPHNMDGWSNKSQSITLKIIVLDLGFPL